MINQHIPEQVKERITGFLTTRFGVDPKEIKWSINFDYDRSGTGNISTVYACGQAHRHFIEEVIYDTSAGRRYCAEGYQPWQS